MSIKFNPLSLHKNYDVHPRSWICVSGNGVPVVVKRIEDKIKLERNTDRENIAKSIGMKLNVSHNSVKILLQGKRDFYPIPIILELVGLCKNRKQYLKEFSKNTETLKVNSASSKPSRALKRLNTDLAKIVGAFMADGSLSYQMVIASNDKNRLKLVMKTLRKKKIYTKVSFSNARNEYYISFNPNYGNFEYCNCLIKGLWCRYQIQSHINIEITDSYKRNIEAFNKWIKNCFGLEPTTFYKKQNAWRSIFSNKILARYLICFFGIKPGYKADKAFESEIIKQSPLNIRKAFARGVLMFDGCAKMEGTIVLETKSRMLAKSISEIFSRDNVLFSQSHRRDRFIVTTRKNVPSKLFPYFEKNTDKWFRLKDVYGVSCDVLGYEKRYAHQTTNKVTITSLKKLINEIESCDIEFLMKRFNCKHTTIMNYLNILRNNKEIRLSRRPKKTNPDFISRNTTVFLTKKFHRTVFSKLKETFTEYKEYANYTGWHTGTVSAWKVKKNRIPLHAIKEMCNSTKINTSKIFENIKETDRMIAESI